MIDKRAQRELDSLGRARGHEHAIRRHRPAATRVLCGNRLPGRCNAGGWAVAIVTVRDRALDRIDHVPRRFETEGNRIADVQVTNAPASRFHSLRFGDDIADGVRELAHTGRDGDGDLNRVHVTILQRELFTLAAKPFHRGFAAVSDGAQLLHGDGRLIVTACNNYSNRHPQGSNGRCSFLVKA